MKKRVRSMSVIKDTHAQHVSEVVRSMLNGVIRGAGDMGDPDWKQRAYALWANKVDEMFLEARGKKGKKRKEGV